MKKNLIYIFSCLIIFSAAFSSCEDMLDTDSGRVAFEEDNDLKSPNDSLYSLLGILSQLQKIGDRYIILGELRGDLMTVSENADIALKEINNFAVSADNMYKERYDYYNIINNCNYAINKMDTSIIYHTEKVMLPEFAAIKAIRAWTYMQIAQIYGKATYIEKPILSLEESMAEYPEVSIDELANLLITDLLPYVDVRRPDYGMIDEKESFYFMIPIRMLLGDLYLLKNEYTKAAEMYHDQIYEGYLLQSGYASYWTSTIQDTYNVGHISSYKWEIMAEIPFSTSAKDFRSNMVKLSYSNNPSLLPVESFIDEMSVKPHFHATSVNGPITGYFEGDLRGSIKSAKMRREIGDSYMKVATNQGNINLITKYINASVVVNTVSEDEDELLANPYILTQIPIYRNPQLYLRYAEAVNRAGKPTLAFSVLKYGLSNTNINDAAKVNSSEIVNNEPYIDFSLFGTAFDENLPTAARGRGLGISRDGSIYVIPDFTRYVDGVNELGELVKVPSSNVDDISEARQDSINWVEEQILDEMAAETAFEGSRFFDLLRISRHRDNHPEFMADKVSRKYESPDVMKNILMNIDSWFIK